MEDDFLKIKNLMKKTFLVLIVIIIIIVAWRNIKPIFYKKVYNQDYLANTTVFYPQTKIKNETSNLITSYSDYQSFIKKYDILDEELTEENFENNDYIYYSLNSDDCSETITLKELEIKNKVAYINFLVETNCDVCADVSHIYMIPVEKGTKIDEYKANYDIKQNETCEEFVALKPILYLYPEYEIPIKVQMKRPDNIITSYPKYKNGWEVTVKPNGDLYDKEGKYYYALYWDEYNENKVDFTEGFYVTKENSIAFLEDKLSLIGLNDRERNEFIMYWLPILENNEKSLVYFELTEEREKYNKLIITPQPDSMLRINMHIKKVNKETNIKEQTLEPFIRTGFTAVEWGGTIYK